MTPKEVLEAVNTLAAYLQSTGYACVVIHPSGGAVFLNQDVLGGDDDAE